MKDKEISGKLNSPTMKVLPQLMGGSQCSGGGKAGGCLCSADWWLFFLESGI